MNTEKRPVIVWFRRDLRLKDNPALAHAAQQKAPMLFLYILQPASDPWSLGAASRWWLHQSLHALAAQLKDTYKANLVLKMGEPASVLKEVVQASNASSIWLNRCYEPFQDQQDQTLQNTLKSWDVDFHSFNGTLLVEPTELLNQSHQFYKVFTPFLRALKKQPIRDIEPFPKAIIPYQNIATLSLNQLELLPKKHWYRTIEDSWVPGETAAQDQLKLFLKEHLKDYILARDRADLEGTSRLSPYLHFGEISPVQIWHAAHAVQAKGGVDVQTERFLAELGWREFSYHLLYHFPGLPEKPFKQAFAHFPWENHKTNVRAWQKGLTGYPMVDAGMRELWHTGWMHNRVRMIVASFLIKHLMQPWQVGEAWFWDTLVDADLANNAASWQWVAGSGADAAPYFRIFNPVLQGQKFDPDGNYVRKWVPELKRMPSKYIHAPWEAPEEILQAAGVTLGKIYPYPIVDHAQARNHALAAYKAIKQPANSSKRA